MTPDRCPLCPRILRGGRPLCNHHMNRAGGPLIKRYFTVAARIRRTDGAHSDARERLDEVVSMMISNAKQYDQIRAAGRHPIWVKTRDTWIDPREHAIDVLNGWISRHRFHLDGSNDRDVIEKIAADLFPPEEGKP